jgi:hypothetical protein
MEAEKTKLLIATQAQKVIEKGTRNRISFFGETKINKLYRGRN